jgi:crotonobetainyl-CoA:carnitine CoA-transferase CaiB-like acyl-CoA transferase
VVDLTAFWAGPAATQLLGALGADVIKVESVQRPDGMRTTSTRPFTDDLWWEWGPVFHGTNSSKRGITLDLTRPAGRDLALRLIEQADLVIENSTPRVVEGFGLGWEEVHATNPRAVMVRMPAFGLDGPWKDRPGFAQTMEEATGLAWVTGYDDGPPVLPRGAVDPLAGMHAALATITALDQRDATGAGCLVEVPLAEVALNAAAEQVITFTATGELLGRLGARDRRAAPQGVYLCSDPEGWIAISVDGDDHWTGLIAALDQPAWAADEQLASAAGRRAAHHQLDTVLGGWCAQLTSDEAVTALWAAGVPVGLCASPADIGQNEQLQARGFFETQEHPVVGAREVPSLPFRFASRGRSGWHRCPPPTLGQHTDEVLHDLLGLDADELAALGADHITGTAPVR